MRRVLLGINKWIVFIVLLSITALLMLLCVMLFSAGGLPGEFATDRIPEFILGIFKVYGLSISITTFAIVGSLLPVVLFYFLRCAISNTQSSLMILVGIAADVALCLWLLTGKDVVPFAIIFGLDVLALFMKKE